MQTLFGASLHTGAAKDAAELFKSPLFGIAADRKGVGRTFFGTQAAVDALVCFNDQLAPFPGKGRTLFKRIVACDRAFDQIAQNIFEDGK
jgi:hypothetical protein